jgi:hypothetical protein
MRRPHFKIYLSDPKRRPPEPLQTSVRQPIAALRTGDPEHYPALSTASIGGTSEIEEINRRSIELLPKYKYPRPPDKGHRGSTRFSGVIQSVQFRVD